MGKSNIPQNMPDLHFDTRLAANYKSESQKIRVLTENWTVENAFCPCCGGILKQYENNRPVADFHCPVCREEFEQKSKRNALGRKITDGAYNTMIKRLTDKNNPHFFFMTYQNYALKDLLLVPKHFFVGDMIERRKPLSPTARRAGWVGCNILLNKIPESGKIFYVKNGSAASKDEVLTAFRKTAFLKEASSSLKGWMLDVMLCIDALKKRDFTLDEVYSFESVLRAKHPENNFIKEKIRQQLQYLRGKGYLTFKGKGCYSL